jgi:hypothetical protein
MMHLHSHYGKVMTPADVFNSMNRRDSEPVRNGLTALWKKKLIDGSDTQGWVLTTKGFDEAVEVITKKNKSEFPDL